ncbi:MAG TPA: hypothetical protein VFP10_07750, partial [Candidatus Eisenbacteria bacterium]|nr:hypothetical protein [Candidatus Eisenbacteria bacterium]
RLQQFCTGWMLMPSSPSTLDLTAKAALLPHSTALRKAVIERSWLDMMQGLADIEAPRERARRIAELVHRLETPQSTGLLKAVGKSSLALEPAGLRVLFGFLEVKRPGGEVLRQLEPLSSLERMTLQLVGGRWPSTPEAEKAVFSILEVLEEGTRAGVIDLALDTLPRNPNAVSGLMRHMKTWFIEVRTELERGGRLSEELIQYVTHLALVEIHCLEDRLYRLAARVDPHDGARMGRLLPLLTRYDQDIEHMKDVVSRLATYQPFCERRLTVEHAISSEEMDRLGKGLALDSNTTGIAMLVDALRRNPLLDGPLAALVAATHELAMRRTSLLSGTTAPDLHSLLFGILETAREGQPLCVRVENVVLDAAGSTHEERGWKRLEADVIELTLRDDQLYGFLQADGLPRFGAPDAATRSLSLKDLVRSQLRNDAFMMGILENPRANTVPGVIEIIASRSRSLRVLDKITRTPSLFSGPANKNVPAQLLLNPSRIPLTSLRRFMNVRFVSKLDLQQMTRQRGALRPEVQHEISAYLRKLKSD